MSTTLTVTVVSPVELLYTAVSDAKYQDIPVVEVEVAVVVEVVTVEVKAVEVDLVVLVVVEIVDELV